MEIEKDVLHDILRVSFPQSVCPQDRIVLTLAGYFDDSGTHTGSEAVVLAGYVSTPEQWAEFDREWLAETGTYDLDKPYFRMTDFANRIGVYGTWSEDVRRARFAKLTDIIQGHAIASIGCVIPMREFESVVSAKARAAVGGAFGFAAAALMMETADLLRPDFPAARIAYFIEAGTKGAGQVLKAFQMNMSLPENREHHMLLSMAFVGKEFAPLQAADIVAYELYKHYPRKVGIDERRPRTEHMNMLARVERKSWILLDENELRKWSAIIDLMPDDHHGLT